MAKLAIFVPGLAFLLATVAGCGAPQYPGAGTAEHCAEARQARAHAAAQQRLANNVPDTKPAVQGRLRAERMQTARKLEHRARRHEQAALAASGTYVSPCAM